MSACRPNPGSRTTVVASKTCHASFTVPPGRTAVGVAVKKMVGAGAIVTVAVAVFVPPAPVAVRT